LENGSAENLLNLSTDSGKGSRNLFFCAEKEGGLWYRGLRDNYFLLGLAVFCKALK